MTRRKPGRPKRTDGRSSQFIRVAVTDEERQHITDHTTPDERRKALMQFIKAKQALNV